MFIRRAMLGNLSLTERVRRALFSNGEQGGMWDATDMSTLFQDYYGSVPVTAVGQPVGTMLDKRLPTTSTVPLDAMAFSPGGSTPPTTADTTFLSEACGSVTFPVNAGGYYVSRAASATTHPIVIGRRYSHSHRIALSRALTGGESIAIYPTGTSGVDNVLMLDSSTASGAWIDFADANVVAAATATGSNYCCAYANTAIASPITVYIRQYTVREIPGNHASQPTTTARPHLYDSPLRIEYDGVDDYLRTVFPALGSNVTIARSVPGVGASIQTGQTINAGNWDDNVTSCATLVIDRALTGPETALVTAFLNQQAGV